MSSHRDPGLLFLIVFPPVTRTLLRFLLVFPESHCRPWSLARRTPPVLLHPLSIHLPTSLVLLWRFRVGNCIQTKRHMQVKYRLGPSWVSRSALGFEMILMKRRDRIRGQRPP